MATAGDIIVTSAGISRPTGRLFADPMTTEIVRHALNSAANQMKRVLMRTAFSPAIYEVLDFAVALYDQDICLLAQAPSLPTFMGTLSFCVTEAVAGVGGPAALAPGDILLYNDPYGAGSHQQDVAIVMPIFRGDADPVLLGYAAIKAHWLDIGGKEPYSTDTIDVFQEGTIFPGVKLYDRGERIPDIYRIILANTRLARAVAGDLNAQVAGVRAGAAEVRRLVDRFGIEAYRDTVAAMYDNGEALARSYISHLPDGRYPGMGQMDSDGITDEPVPFDVTVDITETAIRIDLTDVPDARPGPINCPLPRTMSACRVAVSMLAGADEAPNEGHFRPLEVITRAGSMFHPLSPSPVFLCGRPALHLIEVIYQALSRAMPEAVPACSGADSCTLVWWGRRQHGGEAWADGCAHPVGQGGHVRADGGTCMQIAMSATRLTPVEVWEARNPWLVEKIELAGDSGGAGRHRGGLGLDMFFQMREDTFVTSALERCRTPPWGLAGGDMGRPNKTILRGTDGTRTNISKVTGKRIPAGATVELYCGGGGGYGPPNERDPAAIQRDMRAGYVSEENARRDYPHAFETDADLTA